MENGISSPVVKSNPRLVWLVVILCILRAPLGAATTVGGPLPPADAEVKVAMQSVLVAVAASIAGQKATPPILFAESVYTADRFYSNLSLVMDHADVGILRRTVLNAPRPEAPSGGAFSTLIRSFLFPGTEKLIEFLEPQQLSEDEVVFTGSVTAHRNSASYPYRYEGGGELYATGKRFTQPLELQFSFILPMEGPIASVIIPVSVMANGFDCLHVAQKLFPLPSSTVY